MDRAPLPAFPVPGLSGLDGVRSQETKILPHHSPFPLRPRLPVAFLNMAYIVVPRCGGQTHTSDSHVPRRGCDNVCVRRVVTGRKAVRCRSAHPTLHWTCCRGPPARVRAWRCEARLYLACPPLVLPFREGRTLTCSDPDPTVFRPYVNTDLRPVLTLLGLNMVGTGLDQGRNR